MSSAKPVEETDVHQLIARLTELVNIEAAFIKWVDTLTGLPPEVEKARNLYMKGVLSESGLLSFLNRKVQEQALITASEESTLDPNLTQMIEEMKGP